MTRYACIFIGVNAGRAYAGTASHIVCLGDNVAIPDDSPSNMLYVSGRVPRPLAVIDDPTGAMIKQYAAEIMVDEDRMGGEEYTQRPFSDAFWAECFSNWNATSRASRA